MTGIVKANNPYPSHIGFGLTKGVSHNLPSFKLLKITPFRLDVVPHSLEPSVADLNRGPGKGVMSEVNRVWFQTQLRQHYYLRDTEIILLFQRNLHTQKAIVIGNPNRSKLKSGLSQLEPGNSICPCSSKTSKLKKNFDKNLVRKDRDEVVATLQDL